MNPTPGTYPNLSPGTERTGRACVFVLHDGKVLMTPTRSGRWTLPGGGIEPGESAAQAAIREAWEECGARVELQGDAIELASPSGAVSLCFLARLVQLEPSPEGRPRLWIDPLDVEWRDDHQIAPTVNHLQERSLL